MSRGFRNSDGSTFQARHPKLGGVIVISLIVILHVLPILAIYFTHWHWGWNLLWSIALGVVVEGALPFLAMFACAGISVATGGSK